MIVIQLLGGLGNQMFQYALGRKISLTRNIKVQYDLTYLLDRTPKSNFTYRNYDLDIFKISPEITLTSKLAKKLPLQIIYPKISYIKNSIQKNFILENGFTYNQGMLNNLKDNSYLSGYWQSEKYFKDIEKDLRKDFAFSNPLLSESQKLEAEIDISNSVCINVRRTDYISNPNNIILFSEITQKYYINAYKLITNIVKNPKFYIFSDDISWCQKNFDFIKNKFIVDHLYAGNKFSDYLQLMTKCKYFIIPNSTFAWWGAWLSLYNKKIVIAPKEWFRDKSIDTKDLILHGWIRI